MRELAAVVLTLALSWLPMLKEGCSSEPDWPAGLPHGEEILPNIEDPDSPGAYFDFSAGELVYGEEGKARGDIYLEKTFIAGNPALGVALHDDLADSLLYKRVAPSLDWVEPPSTTVPARVPIYNGHCVWVRTGEGHIAKLKILMVESNENVSSYNWIKIQWIYQPDGSNELRDITDGAPPADETQ